MKELEVKIINPTGLHARPAKKIATVASKFSCDISMECDGNSANAKSVISLMSAFAQAKSSEKIRIVVRGVQDEQEALNAIEQTLKEEKLI